MGVAELEGWCPSNDVVALVKNHFIKSYLQYFQQHEIDVPLRLLKVQLYWNRKGLQVLFSKYCCGSDIMCGPKNIALNNLIQSNMQGLQVIA